MSDPPDTSVRFAAGFRPDLRAILAPMQRGRTDPTLQFRDAGVWRTALTPAGAATQLVRIAGDEVSSDCWGPGSSWLSERTPDLLGVRDDCTGFAPDDDLIGPLWRRWRDRWRVPTGHNVWETSVAAVLEQKVTGLEAKRAWSLLARDYGTPAPGPAPAGMRVFPDAAAMRLVPTWVWRRAGVDRSRSDAILRLAQVPHVLARLVGDGPELARRRLTSIRGIGDWTYAEIAQRALGDADAVSVGDFHLGGVVVHAFTGALNGDDARMLELLQPYAGHRYRAVRMIELSGIRKPRRGPRMAIPQHRYG